MDNIESQISDINIANEMTKMIESMRKNIDSYSATVEKNKKIEQIEQNKRSEKSAILSAEIFTTNPSNPESLKSTFDPPPKMKYGTGFDFAHAINSGTSSIFSVS